MSRAFFGDFRWSWVFILKLIDFIYDGDDVLYKVDVSARTRSMPEKRNAIGSLA